MSKKCVAVGISGGIAAYKACEVVSGLRKLNYTVKVIMTKNACEFVAPLTFETLSNNSVACGMFAPKTVYDVEHISIAKEANVFLVAPATANIIAKLAGGIADDMLTASFLASKAVKIICPAMNTGMYENEITQRNIAALKTAGCLIIEPDTGFLACGDIGKGRMSEPKEIIAAVDKILTPVSDYRGKRVLVTAGATRESIDGVRFISNKSSGKMGIAIAEAALDRGAEVILIAAHTTIKAPTGAELINVGSTDEMFNAVMDNFERCDVIVKAAAPADYTVVNRAAGKIKSEELTLVLKKNIDIAAEIGKIKGGRKLIVFAAETDGLIKYAEEKLAKKNADLIVANDVTREGAGFDCDTNIVTLITRGGKKEELPLMTKREVADIILDRAANDL